MLADPVDDVIGFLMGLSVRITIFLKRALCDDEPMASCRYRLIAMHVLHEVIIYPCIRLKSGAKLTNKQIHTRVWRRLSSAKEMVSIKSISNLWMWHLNVAVGVWHFACRVDATCAI